ncbi:MAG: NUDIX hydrolase [Actinomycetota bacterium]|nr:NUDIX hydrolase [Actinomycetota bacterium]
MTVEITGGGAIFQGIGKDTKVCIIHRGAYNDWTLPKGHIDPGETIEECALREVLEETGLECSIVDHSPFITERLLASGSTKITHYFTMTFQKGGFVPNSETDAIEWLPVDLAMNRLTYQNDKDVLVALFNSYRNITGTESDI